MAIGLTEVPKNSGFGSTSLGEMDNTDESFDLVPDGNYMMQKRAGVFYPVKAAQVAEEQSSRLPLSLRQMQRPFIVRRH